MVGLVKDVAGRVRAMVRREVGNLAAIVVAMLFDCAKVVVKCSAWIPRDWMRNGIAMPGRKLELRHGFLGPAVAARLWSLIRHPTCLVTKPSICFHRCE